MKQIIPGIIFLFFLLPQLQAQKLFVSNAQKLNLQSNSIEVLGKVGERMYTYRASKDGYYLDAFNDSMKLKATITLDFLPEKLVDIGFVPAEDGIKVVYQQSYNSQLVVYVAQLD